MIQRLNKNNVIDLIEFFNRVPDNYEKMYVTINNERKFFKGNWKLIKKILKEQEIYGVYEKGLQSIIIIYREKKFRTYLKILSESRHSESSAIRYTMFNFSENDIYLKLKKEDPLVNYIKYFGFTQVGPRGQEVLLFRKGIKILYKMKPKDLLLDDEENRLY